MSRMSVFGGQAGSRIFSAAKRGFGGVRGKQTAGDSAGEATKQEAVVRQGKGGEKPQPGGGKDSTGAQQRDADFAVKQLVAKAFAAAVALS